MNFFTLSFGMQPVTSLLAGYSADAWTTPIAIRVNGLLLLLSTVLFLAVQPALAEAIHSRPVAAVIDAV